MGMHRKRRGPYRVKRDAIDRFVVRLWFNPDTGCVEWSGSVGAHGYGAFAVSKGRVTTAHRAAMELSGVDVSGKLVLHSCDNRLCVYPEHLRVGTQQDNMDDVTVRGRRPVGEQRGYSKLTNDDVRWIRANAGKIRQKDMAKKLGVHQVTVSQVVCGKTWSHVN